MKKLLLVAALVLGTIACEKYDDTELKDSIVNLQGQINGNKAQIAQLAEANATLQAALAAGDTAAAEALTNAIAELQSAITNGDTEGQALAAQLLDAAINSVNGDIAALALRIESLEGAVKSLEDAVVSYEDLSNVPDIAALIAAAVQEAKDYADANELFEANTDTVFDPSDLTAAVDAIEAYIEANEAAWSIDTDTDTVFDSSELEEMIAVLQGQLGLLSNYDDAVLQAQVQAIMDALAALTERVSTNEEAIAALKSDLDTLTSVVDAIDFVDNSELAAGLAAILAEANAYADSTEVDTVYDDTKLSEALNALTELVSNSNEAWLADQYEADTTLDAAAISQEIVDAIAGIVFPEGYDDTAVRDLIAALEAAIEALDAEVSTLTR